VTTIITGIALYAIGTDQVKGFAVTLILGLLTSMFTAIFFSRVVFDVSERRGWITNLKMMKILASPNYDFLKVRWPAIATSLLVIAIGMFAAGMRGGQMFDIDFTGGSSVTFQLRPQDKMPISAVQDALDQTELEDKNLLVVEREETQTRYSIDTSLQSVEQVQEIIQKTFGDKLLTYSVEIGELKPSTEGEFSGAEGTLVFNKGEDYGDDDGISYEALRERLREALAASGHAGIQPEISSPLHRPGSSIRLKEWTVRLIGLEPDAARSVFEKLASNMEATPMFPMANKIGGRVSSDMKTKALYAIIVSLLGAIAYLWLRFQKASYGLAAATAVAHDVLVTIAAMAISAYVVDAVPALARALQLDAFQINLTIVAALLTIIGYSLNDTIVTFDRLREIKGKSPYLTAEMVNMAVNQCLSRTILTALTVFLTVVILYFFGGEGIHSFAFAFLVGVVAGTYSTIYIAAPVLLWLSGQRIETATGENPRAMGRAG
jgi:SecD/SecF fusion protein